MRLNGRFETTKRAADCDFVGGEMRPSGREHLIRLPKMRPSGRKILGSADNCPVFGGERGLEAGDAVRALVDFRIAKCD